MGNSQILDCLIEAVVAGMYEVGKDQGKPTEAALKTDDGTLVTKTDKRSERAMLEILRDIPDTVIRAEESDIGDSNSPYVIFVDPLDGTGAFATGS